MFDYHSTKYQADDLIGDASFKRAALSSGEFQLWKGLTTVQLNIKQMILSVMLPSSAVLCHRVSFNCGRV
jgi:hypothetical protein